MANLYSRTSVAPSARSWVYPYNQNANPLPQIHPTIPSPVQERQPLPNPFPRNNSRPRQRGLRVVNTTPLVDEHMKIDTNTLGMDFGYQEQAIENGLGPRKKKSIVRKVFGGVSRLPTIFGYGVGLGLSEKPKRRRNATLDTEPSSSNDAYREDMRRYHARALDGTASSGLGLTMHPGDAMERTVPGHFEPEEPISPPPNVVRLSDTLPTPAPLRSSRTHRVPPPSDMATHGSNDVNRFANTSSRFVEPPMTETSASNNHADRTTVMIYDRNSHYPDPPPPIPEPTPPTISRQISSGPGLSYASSEPAPLAPLQPLRPASFAGSQAHVPAAIEPTPIPAPVPRVTYASPTHPPRSRPISLIPAAVLETTPEQPESPVHQAPASITPPPPPLAVQTTNANKQPVTADPKSLQSPVSARPLPTNDYLKMTMSPSSNQTTTTGTTYSYDPSFSSDLSPVARFFKMVYHMPWISHDRVTVDYLPGEGVVGNRVKAKKRKGKHISSWYRDMLARSRRSSVTLDLLSNGTGTMELSPRSSLGAALAALGRKHGRSGEHMKTRKHRHRHHSSSNRHHRRRHETRRHTTSTMDTADSALKSGSPLMPAMYPYPYPSYPYTGYSPFPPLPAPQGQSPPPASPRGPRTMTATAAVYASPQASYAPYPMYVFQPTPQSMAPATLAVNGPSVPAILVPGAVDADHNHAAQGVGSTPAVASGSGTVVPNVLVPGAVDDDHAHGGNVVQKQGQGNSGGQNIPGSFP